MSTATMKKKVASSKKKSATVSENISKVGDTQISPTIPVSLIDIRSNHRKIFNAAKMAELAASISQKGIINNLVVRPGANGRYELVAGERRLRAAKALGLKEVPAVIRILTDAEVIEVQLAENFQREDPHPMEEAYAIAEMQSTYKNKKEIALRLGKSESYVYNRIKLLSLIPSFQEIFISERITLHDSLEIAAVSAESQQAYFENYCARWQDDKDWTLRNLHERLDQFKYDLKNASFNIKDKDLVPAAGACTKCPNNTATLKTLFPELGKEASCTNAQCYDQKCSAHFALQFIAAFTEVQPQAILSYGDLPAAAEKAISLHPEAAALPQYFTNSISRAFVPNPPEKNDFILDTEDGDGEGEFDSVSYADAILEYEQDVAEYEEIRRVVEFSKDCSSAVENLRPLPLPLIRQRKRIRPFPV